MRTATRIQITGALGLCLLGAPLLRLVYPGPGVASLTQTAARRPPPPGYTPSKRALWEAQGWRLQAFLAADDEREAHEACDPSPITSVDREPGRRRWLIARDRYGYLRRARDAARGAVTLARTPAEAYHAAALLARLECYAGHHQAELEQARRLVVLAPRKQQSWMELRRAARCNALETLARQADAAMANLAEPVVMRYPVSSLRRDGLQIDTPIPPFADPELALRWGAVE
jgi:hypothetical protein